MVPGNCIDTNQWTVIVSRICTEMILLPDSSRFLHDPQKRPAASVWPLSRPLRRSSGAEPAAVRRSCMRQSLLAAVVLTRSGCTDSTSEFNQKTSMPRAEPAGDSMDPHQPPARQNACRPRMASASISRLANSSTLPDAIPRASRVILTGSDARRLEMNNAVPSPSSVGFVAMISS